MVFFADSYNIGHRCGLIFSGNGCRRRCLDVTIAVTVVKHGNAAEAVAFLAAITFTLGRLAHGGGGGGGVGEHAPVRLLELGDEQVVAIILVPEEGNLLPEAARVHGRLL